MFARISELNEQLERSERSEGLQGHFSEAERQGVHQILAGTMVSVMAIMDDIEANEPKIKEASLGLEKYIAEATKTGMPHEHKIICIRYADEIKSQARAREKYSSQLDVKIKSHDDAEDDTDIWKRGMPMVMELISILRSIRECQRSIIGTSNLLIEYLKRGVIDASQASTADLVTVTEAVAKVAIE